jgi:hypothetical protein
MHIGDRLVWSHHYCRQLRGEAFVDHKVFTLALKPSQQHAVNPALPNPLLNNPQPRLDTRVETCEHQATAVF